jgi:glycosyltransferase involved in cell wall biosynthesis
MNTPAEGTKVRIIPDPSLPLVSIVTPSYNQAIFLRTTIQSVLLQDYPRIEYIVMDGGSTDGSVDIIKEYSEEIRYWISEPDKGQADAINRGLQMANGEIVAWINSDDAYLPGAVEEAVAALMNSPEVGMVYGDGIMVGTELEVLDRHRYPQLSLVDLLSFEVLLQPAVFMRKEVLEEVGFLDPSYDLILDHELWVRIASHYPIKHISSFWALERTHAQAKTIALAEKFVHEAERMIADVEGSTVLGSIVQENRDRICAGLGVFTARRLIDAKNHREALIRITRAVFQHPKTVAHYWYKGVQAAFSTLGLDPVFMWYRRTRRKLLYRGKRITIDAHKH